MLEIRNIVWDATWPARKFVADKLRTVAGKIAEDTTYRMPGLVARYVRDQGLRVSWRDTGAPGYDLFYREDEHHKAFTPEGDYYDG